MKFTFFLSLLIQLLILFSFPIEIKASLALTETIYTLPESSIDFTFREELYRIDNNYRVEEYKLGIGILADLSIWYSFEYLHMGIIKTEGNELGDSFLKIWYYIGDFLDDSIHLGFMLFFRIPTGVDAYYNEKWRNLSFGKNELKLGPVFLFDILNRFYIHLNTFYTFRQGNNEGFYNLLSLDIFKNETYKNIFGLNYDSENAFLSKSKLQDDYISFSIAVNTDKMYPVIGYLEFYFSKRVSDEKVNSIHIPIEGSAINPLLCSLGCRYFFNESVFIGVYYITSLVREDKYIKDIFGTDFSLHF